MNLVLANLAGPTVSSRPVALPRSPRQATGRVDTRMRAPNVGDAEDLGPELFVGLLSQVESRLLQDLPT